MAHKCVVRPKAAKWPILRHGAAVSVVSSGSEEREFEPHSGSDEVTLFPPSVYHHYGDSYDGGSYQSIGLSAKLPQPD